MIRHQVHGVCEAVELIEARSIPYPVQATANRLRSWESIDPVPLRAQGQVSNPLQTLSPAFTPPTTVPPVLFEITFSR